MPQKRCAFSDFAFRYIRRRSSCNAMGAFVISPLASLGQTEFLIGPGPSLRARFAARPSTVPLTRSDSLTPTPPFPTHGYRKCLFGGISPAGRRGSLQLTRCRSHHVAADTPPVRTAASDSFRRPLLPSRVIDRLGHRVENVYRGYVCVHCTLQPDASRTLLSSMLSEGSAVLLSRHGASLASKPESFGFGRTFTDMTACPLTGHANAPALCVGRHQLLGGLRCGAGGQTPGVLHIFGVDADNGADLIAVSRDKGIA